MRINVKSKPPNQVGGEDCSSKPATSDKQHNDNTPQDLHLCMNAEEIQDMRGLLEEYDDAELIANAFQEGVYTSTKSRQDMIDELLDIFVQPTHKLTYTDDSDDDNTPPKHLRIGGALRVVGTQALIDTAEVFDINIQGKDREQLIHALCSHDAEQRKRNPRSQANSAHLYH